MAKSVVNAPGNNVGAELGSIYICGQPKLAVPKASVQVATVVPLKQIKKIRRRLKH